MEARMWCYDICSTFGGLPLLRNAVTRSISAENPEGEKGGGGKTASNLGMGRKGRPCITLPQGSTVTLAEIEGTGIIQHIWITLPDRTEKGYYVLRDVILRIYWDEEVNPSVEVPLGDFFCNGHAIRCEVNSLPIVVNPVGGMNCYFPMPFRSSAQITVENQHLSDISGFFYQITYSLVQKLPDETAYFHAQWRRENPTVMGRDYTIVDGVKGKGHYVGTYLAIAALSRHWWGEGEIKFYIDGDKEYPTICGTGTEDYVGGAWGFGTGTEDYVNEGHNYGKTYSTLFLGFPLCTPSGKQKEGVPLYGIYRWHIMDPIHFKKDLRVTIQQIGYDGCSLFERSDDVSSVAYWYQIEPHSVFPALPPAQDRWPR